MQVVFFTNLILPFDYWAFPLSQTRFFVPVVEGPVVSNFADPVLRQDVIGVSRILWKLVLLDCTIFEKSVKSTHAIRTVQLMGFGRP
jgi:hypothetical protein